MVFLALALFGCDLGHPETRSPQGPPLRLLSTYPEDGEGLECTPDSGADCGVPINANVQLRFDRYLLPSTVVRQSVEVATGSASAFLQPQYDAIERVAVFAIANGGTWQPGTRYTVELLVAESSPDGWGFRAFDGAQLDEDSPVPIRFTFRTRRAVQPAVDPGPTPDWGAIAEVIDRGGCAQATCHAPPAPSMGLDLSSTEALEATAINEAAHQTESEPNAVEVLENPARFGVQMPILDRGMPGNSYLFYKLLIDPRAYAETCESRYSAPLTGCIAPPKEEVERARGWFIHGEPMPSSEDALSVDDLLVLQRWIAGGAPLEE